MRSYLIGVIGAIGIVVACHTAGAGPSVPSGAALKSGSIGMPVAHHCGKGQRWVPAGYAKHGKYRVGHCAPATSY